MALRVLESCIRGFQDAAEDEVRVGVRGAVGLGAPLPGHHLHQPQDQQPGQSFLDTLVNNSTISYGDTRLEVYFLLGVLIFCLVTCILSYLIFHHRQVSYSSSTGDPASLSL